MAKVKGCSRVPDPPASIIPFKIYGISKSVKLTKYQELVRLFVLLLVSAHDLFACKEDLWGDPVLMRPLLADFAGLRLFFRYHCRLQVGISGLGQDNVFVMFWKNES